MKSKLQPVVHQTKTQALRDQLMSLIETMDADAKLPTMRQLQDSLSVSPMTLNRALSELEANGMVYRRQGSGTYVSPQAKQIVSSAAANAVGLVYDRALFGTQASPFGSILVDEAERRAQVLKERFSLFLAMRSDDKTVVHEDLSDAVLHGRVRGILYAGARNPAAMAWFQKHKLPVVALSYRECGVPRVRINHAQLIRLGVKALAAKGCKRIGLWIPLGNGLGRDANGHFAELEAFQSALKKADIEYSNELVWRESEHSSDAKSDETNQQQGLKAARETFGKTKKNAPDGIVVGDDIMTLGALTFLNKNGVAVGTNLHIATHANKGSDALSGRDELTLIEVDPGEIARAMFEMLETLLRGETLASELMEIKPKLRN